MPESARISLSSLLSRSSCTLPDVLSDLLSELLSDALPLSDLLSDSLPQLSLSHGPSSGVAPSAAGSLGGCHDRVRIFVLRFQFTGPVAHPGVLLHLKEQGLRELWSGHSLLREKLAAWLDQHGF